MSLGQELSALSGSGSKRDVSELELIADHLAVFSADEREKPCALGYDSESSYDPSVLTEDEEFLDDTDDSYRPYHSEDSESENSESEDSESEDSKSEDGDSEDSDSEDSESEDGDYNNSNNSKDLTKIVGCSDRID
jgi:hypothetical protein